MIMMVYRKNKLVVSEDNIPKFQPTKGFNISSIVPGGFKDNEQAKADYSSSPLTIWYIRFRRGTYETFGQRL
jgi:hypothetical protein